MSDRFAGQILHGAAASARSLTNYVYSLSKHDPGHPRRADRKIRRKLAKAARRKNR